jgi:hypothetical protein
MLASLNQVGKQYKTIIAKMVTNSGSMETTKASLVNLCDIGTILGLQCVLFILEYINVLMKFAHARDVIYDYIVVIKICQFAN